MFRRAECAQTLSWIAAAPCCMLRAPAARNT